MNEIQFRKMFVFLEKLAHHGLALKYDDWLFCFIIDAKFGNAFSFVCVIVK